MSDGLKKNLKVIKEELEEFGRNEMRNIKRLASPSLDPEDREHFVPHVLKAFISDFFGLRRTLTEVVTWGIVFWGLSKLF